MKVLIRGSGDVASAVAHRLFSLGHRVLIQEVGQPVYTRRGMAFTDAVFEGKADLQGVLAKRPSTSPDVERMLVCGRAIPVFVGSLDDALGILHPDVLVDARMYKRKLPEAQRGLAPLTIGLGPNFIAGEHADLVIETAWGEQLGQVLHYGPSLPLAGEPRPIAGLTRERFVESPYAGVFSAPVAIGAWVSAGEQVALLNEQPILAPISGYVRGICHAGVHLEKGVRLLEIDPRSEGAHFSGLGERPQRIAAAVVSALAFKH